MSKAVLITGATGKQGGAVINALLRENADFEILAVTRNPNSASGQRLSQKSPSIKLVEGDLDNPAGIFAKAKEATSLPIWGVFSVQVPGGKEELQGKSLVDESIKQGVKFFLYTSVDRGGDASYDNPTDVPHFAAKYRIEHHLVDEAKKGAMDWAILRPTAFFDNFVPGFVGKAFVTAWKVAIKDKPLQLISVDDIGHFGAQAFLKPEEYKSRGISLAGDELTFDQLAKTFKDKTGTEVQTTYAFICSLLMWLVKDLGYMFRWFHDHGYKADVQGLRKIHPGLKDFGTWLEKESKFMQH
ncbi:hypothetical protein GP486_008378 [Trichoglossum hirsutum]|uniref:NmrA-like domain-containing protein n=1 Tax=Trichoglossum hirsutum TaxID=265104 RepID=A0A9P8IB49_9PEZI|nr:hypothetical protein GP486_008378 [Trichoglossum hirsutum]